MAGILQIRRGTVDISALPSIKSGEFYLEYDACKVQIGTSPSTYITLVPLGCSITGDIILNGNVTANNFYGALTGNVTGNVTGNLFGNADTATTSTNANNVNITSTGTNATYYIAFASTTGNTPIYVNTNGISYNPSTNTLTVGTLNATNLTGTITNATSASTVEITDNTSTNASYYLTFVNGTNGYHNLQVDSSTLTYNPNTNTIDATASYASTAGYVPGSTFTSSNPALSSSFAVSASWANNSGHSDTSTSSSWADNSGNADTADTASYVGNALYTASVILNTITFTKGNGSQFNIVIDTGSNIQADVLSNTSPGQILYNNNGAVGGLSVLTYDGSLLRATGSFTGSFSGSLYGTASWAYTSSRSISSSYATSASTALNSNTASYILSSNVDGPFGFNSIQTASLAYTASFVTASNVWGPYGSSSVISASYAVSASRAVTSSYTWFCQALTSSYPIDIKIGQGTSTIYSVNSNGYGQRTVSDSDNVFIGNNAASNTNGTSIFTNTLALGPYAAEVAIRSNDSVMLGSRTGRQSNSRFSVFIGPSAGENSSGSNSNMIGHDAGRYASSTSHSVFIGSSAGENSSVAKFSNFIGFKAGNNTNNASHSVLIGYQSGYNSGSDFLGIGPNNIIIGNNITLDEIRRDSINIGGIIFGTGSYSTISSKAYSGSVNGKIGINVPLPQFTLDVSGSEQLYNYLKFLESGSDPGTLTGVNAKSTYLFNSASNNTNGSDLYIRHADDLVKWKWVEGTLNTGVLYGGILSYAGNAFTLSAGAGIIVNTNTSTANEITPKITLVRWPETSSLVTNIATEDNTFIYIGNDASVNQQNTFFTPTQYNDYIPIGRVSHYDNSTINGVSQHVTTAYSIDQQQNIAIRALGPLKISGFTISGSVAGTLTASVSTGTAFNLGAYYSSSQGSPSVYTNNNTYSTASVVYVYRNGSKFEFDNNSGNYYKGIRPQYWDNGSGTPVSTDNNKWYIQRVTINPVSGRPHIYYGQKEYGSYAEAVAGIGTEPFYEDPSTINSYVLAASIIHKGNASDLTNTNDAVIISAGLIRAAAGGGSGGGGATALSQLSDVSLGTIIHGQSLMYDTGSGKWKNNWPWLIATSSVTASVNVVTGSYFKLNSGSSTFINVTSGSNNSSNFGINTLYPSYSLHVSGTVGFTDLTTASVSHVLMYNTSSGQIFYTASSAIGGATTSNPSYLIYSGSVTASVNVLTSSYFTLKSGSSTFINATSGSSGSVNFGINTLYPSYSLHVSGTVGFPNLTTASVSHVLMYNTASGQVFYTASSAIGGGGTTTSSPSYLIYTGSVSASVNINSASFQLQSGSSTFLYVSSSGNVGIGGIRTPSYKLHVSGTVAFSTLTNNSASNVVTYDTNTGQLFYTSSNYFVRGPGTPNYIPVWETSTKLGNSSIYQNSSRIGVNFLYPGYALDVSSSAPGTKVFRVMGSGSSDPLSKVQGSQGELFSVTDNISGSLFSVNDISGLPIIDVVSDSTILMGNYAAQSFNTTTKIYTTNVTQSYYVLPTSSYDAIFVEYFFYRNDGNDYFGSGYFIGNWYNNVIQIKDEYNVSNVAKDIYFNIENAPGGVRLVTYSDNLGYLVKTIIRAI